MHNEEDISTVANVLSFVVDENGKYPFKIIDSYKNLRLVHYDINKAHELDPQAQNLRGTIVDINTMKIVCSSFGYTPNIVTGSVPEIGQLLTDTNNKDFNFPENFNLSPVTEGALLRVWMYEDEIMVSSHRKINCEKSRWGSSGFFKELFYKYIGDFDIKNVIADNNVAYFILMDKDLTISTKFPIGNRNGLLLFIGTRTAENEETNIDNTYNIPSFSNYNNPEYENCTLFSSWNMTQDEANKHLNQGFYDYPAKSQEDILCLSEAVIVSYMVDNKKKVATLMSPAYYRRFKMVDNDPNILHRCYKIINTAYYPKITGSDDKYLDVYPSVDIMNKEDIEAFSSVIVEGPIPGSVKYTNEQLTDRTDKDSHERRIRNALMWYAMSLSLPHQSDALKNINLMFWERNEILRLMTKNYKFYSTGVFEGLETKYNTEVFKYIQHRLVKAKEFAKTNNINREPSMALVMNNVKTGVLRDSGDWLYNIAKVLIRIPSKTSTNE